MLTEGSETAPIAAKWLGQHQTAVHKLGGVTKTWNGMGHAGTEVTCSGTVFTWSHMFVPNVSWNGN